MTSLRTARPTLGFLLGATRWTPVTAHILSPTQRWAHGKAADSTPAFPRVPSPIPFAPDVNSFLLLIGRNMKQHAAKFPTWEALFTLSSKQLRELGIDPPRDRRYLLRWLQRFREGRYGIGGDFVHVRDGVAELRVRESVDKEDPILVHKSVVNVDLPPAAAETKVAEAEAEGEGEAKAEPGSPPPSKPTAEYDAKPPVLVRGYKVVGARRIAGPYALPHKAHVGSNVTVTEGMWEDKRGRKIDGGERRKAEVRFKKRMAERQARRG